MASKAGRADTAKSLSKSTNKKKETEAANLARRKKEYENETDSRKHLRFTDWSETDSHVTICLHAGKKLSTHEIEVSFTEQDVTVALTDGRKWYCQFYRPIEMNRSKIQLSKMKVILTVKKAEPGQSWSSYQNDQDMVNKPDVLPAKRISKQTQKASTGKPNENPTGELVHADNMAHLNDVQEVNPNSHLPAFGGHINNELIEDVSSLLSGESQDSENEKGIEETEQSKDNQLDVDDSNDIVELKKVKCDFYEKTANDIVAVLYVKHVCEKSVQVNFSHKNISFKFQSSDSHLLSSQHGTNEKTIFLWKLDLVDAIVPEKCSFIVKELNVTFTLIKLTPRKWDALEASQARDLLPLSGRTGWQDAVKMPSALKEGIKSNLNSGPIDKKKTDNVPSTSMAKSGIILDSNKDSASQKPTCMVSPLSKEPDSMVTELYGMTGLENLGNTCFLNSVVQVLANTTELRNYFTGGNFQRELNHDNPLGTGGKLAVAFATLMKILWSGKHRSYAPAKLKNLVGMKNNQFMGFAQHDAQEFMAYLLDGLHEDLNRVKLKPYTSEVDSDGRPDEIVADEAWARHKSRNDSFIVDLFQGQYKSKLVCPACNKVSITFDPFMHLSVPLPRKHKKQLHITFMSRHPSKKPVKYVLWLSKDATVDDLKELMHQKTGVLPSNLRVFESYKNKIHTFLHHGNSLANSTSRDKIYVCEVLSERMAGEDVYQIPCIQCTEYPASAVTKCSNCKHECDPGTKLRRCTKCMRTAYCNHECQKQDWDRHQSNCVFSYDYVGQPFIISLPKSQATFSRIAQMVEAFSRYSLDVFQPPIAPNSQVTRDILPSGGIPATSNSSSSSSCVDDTPSATVTQIQSTDSVVSDMDGQPLVDSQATSTTELASTSSESSFVTVDSGIERVTEDSVNASLDNNQPSLEFEFVLNNGEISANTVVGGSDEGSFGTPSPPTGYVMGHQQDRTERVEPPFTIRPCSSDGKLISGQVGYALEDKGNEPLDLSAIRFLAILWKNNEKYQKPYVLVQTKDMECDEDESVLQAPTEESSNITLDQCLSLFTEPEVLSPDHAWYCPRCKEHREATKQLSIWRLPNYLIIQLKRFSFSSFIWRDKIDKMVEYPVRDLDLRKHFVGTLPSGEPPPIYDLYGVVNHMGGILGGHYTAYARCPDASEWTKNEIGWRLFDDSYVSLVPENQVMTRAGYVLFYRRRQIRQLMSNPTAELGRSTAEEDDNKRQEADTLDEQPSNLTLSSAVNDEQPEFGDIDGDAVADEGHLIASNSSVYSLPSTRIDMDTVD